MGSSITNYAEIQLDEIDALRSIYMDDFFEEKARIGAWNKTIDRAFRISLKADLVGEEDIALTLFVSLPPTYPKSPPKLILHFNENIRQNSRLQAQAVVETKPKSLLGSEMIFEIISSLQEIIDGTKIEEAPTLEEERTAYESATRARAAQVAEEDRLKAAKAAEDEANERENQLLLQLVDLERGRNERRKAKATDASQLTTNEDVPGALFFEQPSATKIRDHSGKPVTVDAVYKKVVYRHGPTSTLFTVQPYDTVEGASREAEDQRPFLLLRECYLSKADYGRNDTLQKWIQNLETLCESLLLLDPHPNITRLVNFQLHRSLPEGKDPSCAIWTVDIITELASKGSLKDLLDIVRALDTDKLRIWAIQIMEGLQHYHRHGMLHASLRPSNILLDQGEAKNIVVKLSDGGFQHCIHLMKGRYGARPPLAWTAPEVIAHGGASSASDIWDFGVCLVQMALGLDVVNEHHSPAALLENVPFSRSLASMLTRIFCLDSKARPSAWDLLHFEFFRNDETILDHSSGSAAQTDDMTLSIPSQLLKSTRDSAVPVFTRYGKEFVEEGRLGRGGFGEVYRARNKVDGQLYAIKKVKARSKAALDPVLSEATVLSRLNHPNVVRYFASWIDDGIVVDEDQSQTSGEGYTTSSISNIGPRPILPLSSRGLDFISSNNGNVVFATDADNDIPHDEEREESTEDEEGQNVQESSSSDEDINLEPDDVRDPLDGGADVHLQKGHKYLNSHDQATSTILYIQMEYCKQETLRDLINHNIQANTNESWRLFRQIIQGLAHIHALHIVHRDLKPENIFIDSGGDVRIGDFGLARPGEYRNTIKHLGTQEPLGSFTKDIGTAFYVAPEVRSAGNGKYNEKADMYSLGIILFEMNVVFLTAMERAETLDPLQREDDGLPQSFDLPGKTTQAAIFVWLTEHNPSKRPSTSELLDRGQIPIQDESETFRLARRELNDPKSRLRSELISSLFSVRQTFGDMKSTTTDLAQSLRMLENVSSMSRSLPNLELQSAVRRQLVSLFSKHGAVERTDSPVLFTLNQCYMSTDTVKFLDSTGTLLQLPYDLILPNAMLLAKSARPELKTFIFDDVYRTDLLQDRLSIFGEANFDIVSRSDTGDLALSEAETMKVVDEILDTFPNLSSVQMCYHINHTHLLDKILSFCEIEPDKWVASKETISKLNTADWTWTRVRHELRAPPIAIASTCLDELERFDFRDTLDNALTKVRSILQDTNNLEPTFGHLRNLTKYLTRFGLKRKVYLNPLSSYNEKFYRNNFLFQCIYDQKKRAVFAAGGRYDQLIRAYQPMLSTKTRTHAVGFQLTWSGLCTGLMNYLKAQAKSKARKRRQLDRSVWATRRCDCLVDSFDEDLLHTVGVEILNDLWANDVSAELATEEHDAMANNSYNKNGSSRDDHSWAILIKSDEVVKIRNLNRQDEEEVRRSEIVSYLRIEMRDRARVEARNRRGPIHRQVSHQDSSANIPDREVDIKILMSQNKGKKVNRKTIVEEALAQTQDWCTASLDNPVIAVETKEDIFDAISHTRFDDADSWKKLIQGAPPGDRHYLGQVQALLKEQKGSRAAFIYNFRTKGVIHYHLGKD